MTRGKDSNPLSFWRDNAAQNGWPDIHQELLYQRPDYQSPEAQRFEISKA
jgi:hypothetical protein